MTIIKTKNILTSIQHHSLTPPLPLTPRNQLRQPIKPIANRVPPLLLAGYMIILLLLLREPRSGWGLSHRCGSSGGDGGGGRGGGDCGVDLCGGGVIVVGVGGAVVVWVNGVVGGGVVGFGGGGGEGVAGGAIAADVRGGCGAGHSGGVLVDAGWWWGRAQVAGWCR